MSDAIEPTQEGLRRFPGYVDEGVDPPQRYAAGYNHSFNPAIPCTCTPDCKVPCAGECGCEACKMVFAEYANICGWFGPEPFVVTEEHLQQYRDALGPAKRHRT